MRKVIINVSIIYFLLLTGYKFFSLYYPLYLNLKGISLLGIGINYFLLYFSLGIFSLLFSFIRQVKLKRMIIVAIGGYAIYSLGMIFISSMTQFLILQVLLGFFAGMFYVFARITILEETKARASEYGYFYITPIISSLIAPIVGGILIYFFGFFAAFVASIVIYLTGIIFTTTNMKDFSIFERKRRFEIKDWSSILFFFSILLVVGMYRAFFVLFLKSIGMSQNSVIFFILVVNALVFTPLIISRKSFDKYSTREYISIATIIYAFVTAVITFSSNIMIIFFLFLLQYFIFVFLTSQKSGWLSRMSIYKKEIAIIDTCIESFGVAVGALISGYLISSISFQYTFLVFSIFLTISTLIFSSRNYFTTTLFARLRGLSGLRPR